MKFIRKILAFLLLKSLILSNMGIFALGNEGMSELEALRHAYTLEEHSTDTLFFDKKIYETKPEKKEKNLEVFQSSSDILGASYIVTEKSAFSRDIENRRVTSELLEKTMIFNKHRENIDPNTLSIEPLTGISKIRTEQKLRTRYGRDHNVMSFEFGIQGTHLIFSEPVRLSVDAPDARDGTLFDLLVLHAGDTEYNTHGLMTYAGGKCFPDGSASHPSSKGVVKNGKVEFFTCGASTFALGYVPKMDFPNNTVWTIASDLDGKTIIGGEFTTVGTATRTRLARLTKESFVDPTFTNPNVNNTVYTTAIQGDGKIIIGGAFTTVGGIARNYLARLNTDGTLDTTWNPNANNEVRTILIQGDGKVLIGGAFTTVGGVARNRIARINTDGTLDAAFNPNSNNIIYALALEGDGQILVGGTFTTIAATARNRVARLNINGTIDATFNPNSNNTVWDIELFSDGTIALGGQFTTIGGTTRRRLAKVSAAGVLDATWNPNVTGGGAIVYTLEALSDNSLIFGGNFNSVGGTARNNIAKVSTTGVLNLTFDPDANGNIYAGIEKADGTHAVGGAFTTMSALAQPYYTEIRNNTVDTEYNLGINNTVWTLSSYSTDTQVVLGGQFTTINGIAMGRVALVSTGGFLDPTFTNPNVNNTVYTTAIQGDGKIIIGGAFTTVGGIARNYLARLNTDGTLDTTWNPNANNEVRTILIQGDGKVLIGGAFTTVGGVARNRIARINTDGTLDAAFNPNSNNIIYALALEGDGQILVGGTFTTIAATARNRVARLNINGTIDATFNPNANNTVWDIELFSDETIALGGSFTTIGGTARNNIAKVSALGALDVTWNPNANGIVYALSVNLTNNSLIFGGAFTTIGGTARNRIAQVNSAGTLDTTLNPNASNTVYALGRDIHGNLLAGGAFTTMSTKAVPYFAWVGLSSDTTPPTILSNSVASGTLAPLGTFPITITYSDSGAGIDPGSLRGKIFSWDSTGSTWSPVNLAPTYLSITSSTTGTGVFQLTNLPFGKYRFDLSITDLASNTRTQSYTYFIDAVEWTISAPLYDIGNAPLSMDTFGTDELILTVRTVGAGFDLSMIRTDDLTHISEVIPVYSGSTGWGYDKNIGAGYSSSITAHGTNQTLVTVPKNINTDGQINTFTYRVKYGVNPNANNPAGDYVGDVRFGINLTY